jgi:signal transduction histidine kinase
VQVRGLSFLTQARVQVLGLAGQVVADSGSPETQSIYVQRQIQPADMVSPSLPIGFSVDITAGMALTNELEHKPPAMIYIREGPVTSTMERPERIVINTSVKGPPGQVSGTQPMDFLYQLPAVGTQFGFGLGSDVESDGRRSDQVVREPIHDHSGNVTGYVQLSEGPAYGRLIVDSVALGWALASVVAVLLAAGVGWLISRRISGPVLALTTATTRMAAGDLSTRADLARQDEFGALANAFNEMAARVEETVVTLHRFLGDAAHELHTPLTALRTNLELAASEPVTARRAAFLERAQQQAVRLELLTNELLDLSRIETGAPAGAAASLNLSALVREVSEAYASRAEQCGLQFALQLPEQDIVAQGHEAQLRRALGNLLDNAIKFTSPGGSVTAGLRKEEQWIEMWVQDTGIGIPPDALPLLFSRFHRARNATAYPGSGLGLAIVKAIAQAHGGEVSVQNMQPGARFCIRLPQPSAS